jgi:hypothetical protein
VTTATAPSHDRAAHTTRHITQLTQPYTITVHQRPRAGRTTWTAIIHPALLDQLREACTPAGGSLTVAIRRRHRESAPPLIGDGIDALSHVYTGITVWHTRLYLPSPDRALDWQKAALRQISTALQQVDEHDIPVLTQSIIEDLAHAIEDWWQTAARASGWRPEDLRYAR